MTINLETPALLFPAIALLLLAYTNRYHFIVTLIRELLKKCESEDQCDIAIVNQCKLLKQRVLLIRRMQQLLVGSLLICVFCIATIALSFKNAGLILFIISICTFVLSLLISLREVTISIKGIVTLLDKYIN
jgi:hypothetical protein